MDRVNVAFYRRQAKSLRTIARQMTDVASQTELLILAKEFEKLAKFAENQVRASGVCDTDCD